MKSNDIILIAVVASLTLGAVTGIGLLLNRPFSSDEMHKVLTETSSMTASEALQAFHRDGISDTLLARTLNSSRHTIRRLRKGGNPVPSMEATILGLYSNYLLMGRPRFILCYSFSKYDQWYAFRNPLQELPDSSIIKH